MSLEYPQRISKLNIVQWITTFFHSASETFTMCALKNENAAVQQSKASFISKIPRIIPQLIAQLCTTETNHIASQQQHGDWKWFQIRNPWASIQTSNLGMFISIFPLGFQDVLHGGTSGSFSDFYSHFHWTFRTTLEHNGTTRITWWRNCTFCFIFKMRQLLIRWNQCMN